MTKVYIDVWFVMPMDMPVSFACFTTILFYVQLFFIYIVEQSFGDPLLTPL